MKEPVVLGFANRELAEEASSLVVSPRRSTSGVDIRALRRGRRKGCDECVGWVVIRFGKLYVNGHGRARRCERLFRREGVGDRARSPRLTAARRGDRRYSGADRARQKQCRTLASPAGLGHLPEPRHDDHRLPRAGWKCQLERDPGCEWWKPGSPKLTQPIAIRLTLSPDWPSRPYSISTAPIAMWPERRSPRALVSSTRR